MLDAAPRRAHHFLMQLNCLFFNKMSIFSAGRSLRVVLGATALLGACQSGLTGRSAQVGTLPTAAYFAPVGAGVHIGGVQVIPIKTPKGTFNVWTKRIGNNPKIKVLLLHGGPGLTHEYLEAFESFFPQQGIEFIYYDQLGCGNSDNPKDTTLWSLPRYVEEVEQVRQALHLTKDNFYLYGHSWGAMLGVDYALKYQQNLKGLIISNMMMSAQSYNQYNERLDNQLSPAISAEIKQLEAKKDFANPRYTELLMNELYPKHAYRMPLAQWPEPILRSLSRSNHALSETMLGAQKAFSMTGKLAHWDRTHDLPRLTIPVLSIGAKYDYMDPAQMAWIATQVQQGTALICPSGSHLCLYDDQQVYMSGLIGFLKTVDDSSFKPGTRL
jgi:proline iminopeptidase